MCAVSIEQRFSIFLAKAKEDNNWLKNNIVKYLQGHRLRVESKEITGSTLRNYIKPIKLFCEQMDIEIPWRKIIRGDAERKEARKWPSSYLGSISETVALLEQLYQKNKLS